MGKWNELDISQSSYSLALSNSGGDVNLILRTADGTTPTTITSSTIFGADQWIHVMATRSSGGARKLFINGTEVANDLTNLSMNVGVTSGFTLGSTVDGDSKFNGSIDEATIWSRVLANAKLDALVHTLVNGNLTDASNDLVAAYHFDEPNLEATVYDASINELNGTKNGTPTSVPSTAPSNRKDEFSGLNNKSAIWSGKASTTGGDITVSSSDTEFLKTDGDYLMFSRFSVIDAITQADLTGLNIVTDRFESEWYFDMNDVDNDGGQIDITFPTEGVSSPDFSYTFYLIYRSVPSGDYEVVEYDGYTLNGTSLTFNIDAQELQDGYYTFGFNDKNPIAGNALSFNGTNEYVRIGDSDDFAIANFTAEAWIKPSDVTGTQFIMGQGGTGASDATLFRIQLDDNIVRVNISDGSSESSLSVYGY